MAHLRETTPTLSSLVIGLCKVPQSHELKVGDDVCVRSPYAFTDDGHYYKDGTHGTIAVDLTEGRVVSVTPDEIRVTTRCGQASWPAAVNFDIGTDDSWYTHFTVYIFKYEGSTWSSTTSFGMFSSRDPHTLLTEDQVKAVTYHTSKERLGSLMHIPGKPRGAELPTL